MSFVAILKIGGLRARLVCLGFQSWFWFISYCWNRVTGWSMKDLNTFLNFPTLNVWQQHVWFSTLVMRVRFHTSPEARMVWSTFFSLGVKFFWSFFVDGTDEQMAFLKNLIHFPLTLDLQPGMENPKKCFKVYIISQNISLWSTHNKMRIKNYW